MSNYTCARAAFPIVRLRACLCEFFHLTQSVQCLLASACQRRSSLSHSMVKQKGCCTELHRKKSFAKVCTKTKNKSQRCSKTNLLSFSRAETQTFKQQLSFCLPRLSLKRREKRSESVHLSAASHADQLAPRTSGKSTSTRFFSSFSQSRSTRYCRLAVLLLKVTTVGTAYKYFL